MNFDQLFEPRLELIKRKHRSRIFGDLEGPDCHFPQAFDYRLQRRVTNWCSSDYLGMSEHPAVLAAMRDVIDQTGGSAGRVGVWRGGCRPNISVAAPFVWRCLTGSTVAPFPHSAHRTGHADFPHPALGQDFTPSLACDAVCSF
jgi:hypothetical protein